MPKLTAMQLRTYFLEGAQTEYENAAKCAICNRKLPIVYPTGEVKCGCGALTRVSLGVADERPTAVIDRGHHQSRRTILTPEVLAAVDTILHMGAKVSQLAKLLEVSPNYLQQRVTPGYARRGRPRIRDRDRHVLSDKDVSKELARLLPERFELVGPNFKRKQELYQLPSKTPADPGSKHSPQNADHGDLPTIPPDLARWFRPTPSPQPSPAHHAPGQTHAPSGRRIDQACRQAWCLVPAEGDPAPRPSPGDPVWIDADGVARLPYGAPAAAPYSLPAPFTLPPGAEQRKLQGMWATHLMAVYHADPTILEPATAERAMILERWRKAPRGPLGHPSAGCVDHEALFWTIGAEVPGLPSKATIAAVIKAEAARQHHVGHPPELIASDLGVPQAWVHGWVGLPPPVDALPAPTADPGSAT